MILQICFFYITLNISAKWQYCAGHGLSVGLHLFREFSGFSLPVKAYTMKPSEHPKLQKLVVGVKENHTLYISMLPWRRGLVISLATI